jgi:4a-hydroxytetrahydrobiopterin dehydratase
MCRQGHTPPPTGRRKSFASAPEVPHISLPHQPKEKKLRPMADLLDANEIKEEIKRVPEWDLLKNKSIERTFEFDDFTQAIDFVNAVAEISEEEEHHPEIDIRYNRVRLVLSTHSEGGLTENDFTVAEKIDTLSE